MTETKRVLDADVYDTLELAAEAFGGVGCGWMFEYGAPVTTPCCIHGLAAFAEDSDPMMGSHGTTPIRDALFVAGISGSANDSIFDEDEDRIPFAEWCKRLGVERGSDV